MAKHRKTSPTPSNGALEIVAPKALAPLMQAFHVGSEKVAKALIKDAANAIYGIKEDGFNFHSKREISKEELDGIVSLMKSINPRDTLETLYAAQIVASHMLGMRKLSDGCPDDQKLGLKLLRFSNEAMQQLDRKRNGGTQNITVNYNYQGQGNALMQTVIPEKPKGDYADQRS